MKIPTIGAVIAALILSMTVVARGADEPDGVRWWSHVAVLADDRLEGATQGARAIARRRSTSPGNSPGPAFSLPAPPAISSL